MTLPGLLHRWFLAYRIHAHKFEARRSIAELAQANFDYQDASNALFDFLEKEELDSLAEKLKRL